MENNKKLTQKDLITIGVFTALYLGVVIVISGLTLTPVLQYLMVPIAALLTAPIYLLYLAKVQKFGAILITGVISSLLVGLLVYANPYCAMVNMAFFILAEIIAYIGKYKSDKLNNLSFIVCTFWALGEMGLPWVAGQYFYDLSIKSGYSVEWAEGVKLLATPMNLVWMILGTVVCAIISILFAKNIFKKHFKKAGII